MTYYLAITYLGFGVELALDHDQHVIKRIKLLLHIDWEARKPHLSFRLLWSSNMFFQLDVLTVISQLYGLSIDQLHNGFMFFY
jgi:hypothetical protein